METPNGLKEIEKLFGNPAKSDGRLNEAWESANIRIVAPPKGWQLYYQADHRIVKVSGIRMHRLLRDSFLAVLEEIENYARQKLGASATDEEIFAWLHKERLDLHGGGFNFRKKVGSSGLSLHSYGIAIDWDPDHNPRKKPLSGTLPDWWYDIWQSHGWVDGRNFPIPDPMHVQFARGA